jgi:hypothetical protein
MSYQLVKRISFKKDGVYFSACSNNVIPKNYYSEKSKYHSKLLESEGKESVIKIILWDFISGNFQSLGDNENINKFSNVAKKVKLTNKYNELSNIYWEWDNIKRSIEEKEKSKEEIQELLFNEWNQ